MLWIRKYINQTPSFNYFETHYFNHQKKVETNPALCIKPVKSLVESVHNNTCQSKYRTR